MSYLYPYGDTQQLNLSWFLAKFKELYEYISNLDPDDIALATVLSRFTNEYNSSTNYIPGDYAIHEGFIYKANQSTTGNFNPEAWDAALPVNDIQGLRILLGGISRDLTDLAENAVTDVQYTPGAASADGLLRQMKNGTADTVMTVDKEPTANSQNPVKSGAVQAEIAAVSQALGSERTDRQNADTSLQNQIDDLNAILPLDTTPTSGSTKGVTSGGVDAAIQSIRSSHNTLFTPSFTLDPNNPPTIDNIQFAYSKVSEALLYIYGRFRIYAKNTTNTSLYLIMTIPDGFEISTATTASLGYMFDNNGITKFIIRPASNYTSIFIAKGANGAYSMSDLAEGSNAYYVLTALIPIEF